MVEGFEIRKFTTLFFFTFLFFSLFFELPKVGGKQGWRTTTAPLIGSFKVQVASGYEYAVDN